MLIIRGGQSGVACSLVIQAGTDDAYAPVKIVRAVDEGGSSKDVSEEKISGISFDENGAIKLRVTFDSPERYALNVTAYEI